MKSSNMIPRYNQTMLRNVILMFKKFVPVQDDFHIKPQQTYKPQDLDLLEAWFDFNGSIFEFFKQSNDRDANESDQQNEILDEF